MKDYNASYLGRVFNSMSQMGHAISGGSPDISISAKIGYKNKKKTYWKIINAIVDFTFYPIDGPGHCRQAYLADEAEDYTLGNEIGLVPMTLFVSSFCFILIPFLWGYKFLFGRK